MNNHEKKWKILRVLTTNQCNYECIYCHNEGQECRDQSDMITFNQFIRYFSIVKSLGVEEVRFSGGEPLYNQATIEMIEWLNENSDVEIGLATNGSLMTDEIVKRLGQTRTMVTLHLPGVGDENYYKVTKRKWSSFEKCVELFDKYNIDYSFNYTLFPDTISAVDAVIDYAVAKGRRVKLLPFLEDKFNNLSEQYIDKIIKKMELMESDMIHFEKEGFYLWTFPSGGAVKIIDSPCYERNISLCREYGEVRLLPDLSLMNCIFGENYSTDSLSDNEILELFRTLWDDMKSCANVISR